MKMNTDLDAAPGAPQKRWAVVDDNRDILLLMHAMAGRFTDAPIECFNSPAEALAVIAEEPNRFELVITDFVMPGMNGAELCCRIHEIAPRLRVLLSTGSELLTDAEALARGFCGLLHKPFLMQSLRSVLVKEGFLGDAGKNIFAKSPRLMPA